VPEVGPEARVILERVAKNCVAAWRPPTRDTPPRIGSNLLGFGFALRTCGPTALFILIFIYSYLSTF
jgi:hypothetical protein